jgi:hypothetical protein
MFVRERPKKARNHELDGVQISSILPVVKEAAMVLSIFARSPGYALAASPRLQLGDSIPTYTRTSQDCGSSTA